MEAGGQIRFLDAQTVAEVTTQDASMPDHSDTNIQERGADEGDIVKTNGQTIYLLSDNEFLVIDAWPTDELEVSEHLVYEDPWFAGMLIPGIALAARDKDERVRSLARRALEVLARDEPLDFRREVLTATED